MTSKWKAIRDTKITEARELYRELLETGGGAGVVDRGLELERELGADVYQREVLDVVNREELGHTFRVTVDERGRRILVAVDGREAIDA